MKRLVSRHERKAGHHWLRTAAFLVAAVLVATSAAVGRGAPATNPVLAAMANQQGVSADRLELSDTTTITLPNSGVVLNVGKAIDRDSGAVYQAALDQNGRAVDLAAAQKAEQSATQNQFGKLDPALGRMLSSSKPAQKIPVSIWVRATVPVSRQPGTSLSTYLENLHAAMTVERAGVVHAVTKMNERSVEPLYGPVVFATLSAGQIKQIERRADVLTIYGPSENANFQDDSATTERANTIWANGNLGFGVSSRPVVHESDGVSDTNPYLNNASHPVIFWCSSVTPTCPNGKNFITSGPGIAHASKVAGAIAATHPLYRGIAPSAQIILSANSQNLDDDTKNVQANEWARGNGGDPTNMSWGQICPDGNQSFMSRYVDWAERNLGQTFVISSGNTRGCSTNDLRVSAPGLAWGPITVGAIGDGNNGFWNDDAMTSFSRYIDPLTGQDKPEVVAVGADQALTNQSGISFGNAGTSFSAPQVAGQVVDMLARQPGQNNWPETNKAAVLASAYHDVAAGTDQDGLGAVVMRNSDESYRLGRFFNECGAGCGPMLPADFPRDRPVSLLAGQRVKVAISWDSNSNGSSSDVLGADIDLQVFSPGGGSACSSISISNAWESCEFTAPVTGTYTFRERLFSSDAGWPGTFLGMAWSIRTIPDICTIPPAISVPAAGGTFNINTANGPTFFDSYTGWPTGQTGREQLLAYPNLAPHRITVTDTNASVDLHILQFPGNNCAVQPIVPTVVAQGGNSAVIPNAPAGRYFIVGDSNGGGALADTITVTIGPPS